MPLLQLKNGLQKTTKHKTFLREVTFMTTSAIIMAIIGIVIIWGGGLALSILKAKNASND
ncbi:hypothetical protein JCM21714_1897 [Gracilibacillus boraciitolerans JCM 21714]|uniref:Uncharacterized protein n=1 Tax=Gracilibacillus boraciitolerans JCM 21714 TaxID=1298598 RepID=W4VI81_9BACI|nr:hypothetical protein JCM21714_1897 [Gracilibacillus boraciitolerans JCM 21714]